MYLPLIDNAEELKTQGCDGEQRQFLVLTLLCVCSSQFQKAEKN